jgi:hypothetical protein
MIRRNLVNLLIAAVLYFNLAALLLACNIRFPSRWESIGGALPNHWSTQRLFQMFSLFGGITQYSVFYSAWGSRQELAVAPAEPGPDLIDLDVYRYFPQTLGEANRRLGFATFYTDEERVTRSYRRMADTIQRWHAREHPEDGVVQVFIYKHWWPKSELGYHHLEDQRGTRLVGHN